MTITKKQWMMLLLGAGVLFLVYWFFFRKKKTETESSYDENLMILGNENGYGPAYGAYGSYSDETGYILCPKEQCEVRYSYWDTTSDPPIHLTGSYCGSCKTGSPTKVVKGKNYQSNYVEKRKPSRVVGRQAGGGGVCFIMWTDTSVIPNVEHKEEIPCSNLGPVISKE